MHRAGESPNHLQGKILLARLFDLLGYLSFFERWLSDVVAQKLVNGRLRRICAEYERSMRNVIRNLTRNFTAGCDAMVTLVPDEKLRAAMRRKLKRELPRDQWTKVGIVTMSELQRVVARLEARARQVSVNPPGANLP
jgi:hypothetical protein